mmetsp:Transcript_19529/g.39811  ORF Transcript_19529/g.39811 Transcript_19529/m.39811 type:complete len:224 (+) Transcript_19529:180-851(+)
MSLSLTRLAPPPTRPAPTAHHPWHQRRQDRPRPPLPASASHRTGCHGDAGPSRWPRGASARPRGSSGSFGMRPGACPAPFSSGPFATRPWPMTSPASASPASPAPPCAWPVPSAGPVACAHALLASRLPPSGQQSWAWAVASAWVWRPASAPAWVRRPAWPWVWVWRHPAWRPAWAWCPALCPPQQTQPRAPQSLRVPRHPGEHCAGSQSFAQPGRAASPPGA